MSDQDREGKLQEIRERWGKATEGPWQWFGNTKFHDIYLATKSRGRVFVMQFDRFGMGGAQPVFQVRDPKTPEIGRMIKAQELVHYEVNPPAGQQPYRYDIDAIDNPDAAALEHSWQDVQDLLAEIDRLKAELAEHVMDAKVRDEYP